MVEVCTRSCHADLMPRLIALTEERGASVAWINPEHIVSVRPLVTRAGNRASVLAEIKLAGMPTERFVVDRDCAAGDLDQVWSAFIATLETGAAAAR